MKLITKSPHTALMLQMFNLTVARGWRFFKIKPRPLYNRTFEDANSDLCQLDFQS